ncbi:hypothetical protein JOE59_000730 [Agromyces cerinus]|uniref:DUF6541 family protein n=1 Tax=Agromyces cerinus TaxID=33878 RepID=UPI00195DFF24|nr:DUF6541 family protein [Agromyces cerinus]MBM7830025.1 hypothetical protein [Agromyces cerinus]
MTWFDALPALTVATLLLFGLGAPFAAAIGARGVGFLGLAAGGSVAIVAASSIAAPVVGLGWNLGVPVGAAIITAVIGLALRRFTVRRGRRSGEWGRSLLGGLSGIVVGAVLIGRNVVLGIGAPDHPSQTYDGVFHLNAVRWILNQDDASPLHLVMTTPGSSSGFYPTVWHAFTTLIVQLTGSEIVVAANAMAVVMACILWPVAAVFLVRAIFGAAPLTLAIGGALSAAFAAFPATLLWFGVLYPNILAIALLPIALGAVVLALRATHRTGDASSPADAGDLTRFGWWAAALLSIGGMSLAHPNALFSLFVLSAPLVVERTIRFVRSARSTRARAAAITGAVAVFAIELVLWTRFGTTDNGWIPNRTFVVAILEALTNGPINITIGVVVTLLVMVGVAGVFLRRTPIWLVIAYGLSVLFFAVANGAPVGPLRTAITGLWYNDAFRLAAVLPVTAVALATIGLVMLIEWTARGIRALVPADSSPALLRTAVSGAIALVLIVAVVGTQFGGVQRTRGHLADAYRFEAGSPVLSPDEAAVFAEVAELTPEDAVIAGNPWNGSSLVYAYADRAALFPHLGGRYPEGYWDIAEGLGDGTAAACSAAAEFGVDYVLDFGDRFVFQVDARTELYPGLTDLQDATALTLLASRGDAKLYEVTGC